jgi:hypothetical protein
MQANLDVFVDGDNGYGAEPARVTHQLRERPLNFVAAVQGIPPGQEASHLAQPGIQRLS